MNIVSGARISFGGLHLGHFLGCIQHLIDIENKDYNYFFILNDCLSINKDKYLTDMLLDLYAIKNTFKIDNFYVVLDSWLMNDYSSFANYLRRNVTISQLLSIYPQNGTYAQNSVNDFLFPIEQAMTYYLFDAEQAFLNDDNLRFVTFSAELAKKINNIDNNIKLPVTRLKTGKIPRLLGYDYQKMSKANNNAIFLTDELETIHKKIYKLFDMHFLFKAYPQEVEVFNTEYPYMLPDYFLPFQYFKAFSKDDHYTENNDLKNSKNRNYTRQLLTDIIMQILLPIQENRKCLSCSQVLSQFSTDYIMAKKKINDKFSDF